MPDLRRRNDTAPHQRPVPSVELNDERLDDLAHQVRAVASLTTIVATHDAKIDAAQDDNIDMKRWVADVEARVTGQVIAGDEQLRREILAVKAICEQLHEEYRDNSREGSRSRIAVAVVILAGIFTVVASLVTAVATVLS